MSHDEKIWWYAANGKESGPYTARELKSMALAGKIAPADLIWREGLEKWLKASAVKGLFEPAAPRSDAAVPPPPASEPADPPLQSESEMEGADDRCTDAFSMSGEHSSGTISDDEAMQIFVGKKYDLYVRKWARFAEKKLSWNWPGFFLNITWLIYRKMYRPAALLFAAMMGAGVIVGFLHISEGTIQALGIAVNVLVGLQGNYWYKLHAERKIKRIKECIVPHQIRNEITRQGGTNLAGALIFFLLIFLLVIISRLGSLNMAGKI